MKKLCFILITVLIANCKNTKKQVEIQKEFVADKVAKTEDVYYKTDTLVKTSKVFMLNGLNCYWEHFFMVYKHNDAAYEMEVIMKLKKIKTNQVILEISDNPRHIENYQYQSDEYFEAFNKNQFVDLNFDGFLDFKIYNEGSTPMTSMTNIYTFNKKTGAFEMSELSDNTIEELDITNKTLTTSSWSFKARYTKKHHFGKQGSIKFSEYFDEEDYMPNDTTWQLIKTYTKVINNKSVEIKKDTIAN